MKLIKLLLTTSILASFSASASSQYDYSAVTLTRFAIQSLYAPKRLILTPEGIHRAPMQTEKHVPLFYGASIDAMPLASWRAGPLFITAVELKNLLSHPISIDAKTIKGDWQTAALYPSTQLPSQDKHETTTIFLVSSKPFDKALNGHKDFVS